MNLIRRYVYHDVIRLGDAQKLIDCSLVQPYTTNSAKVVFLKQRPILSRPFRASFGNLCISCDRSLQHPYLFCSLSCKVNHLVALKKETTNNKEQKPIQNCELLLQPPKRQKLENLSETADDQITPDSVLNSPVLLSGSTGSISSGGGEKNNCTTVLVSFAAATEFVKKNKKIKKKGVPQRSPLY
ncbi:uncharacterized protein LOC112091075 [Morus notabilis]|uniref:uncharacterized protein LOC112091075 n=1 Tax=Morus notabilis TaxID=981085 RepID=UPI000CECF06C|nr:uncharacterized protein LOC112091075 [Morus notabilis]